MREDDQIFIQRDQRTNWSSERGVAVLIDGENMASTVIGIVQSCAERLGTLTVQYVFGNWESPTLSGWRALLESHRLEMRHHEPVAAGKNTTDINLVMFAMRLFMQGYRIFCIVASDSDYTPLFEYLRDQGCLVIVFGKAMTPRALRVACSVFVDIARPISFKKDAPTYEKSGPPIPSCGLDVPEPTDISFWVFNELRSYEPLLETWVHVPTFRDYLKNTYGFRPRDHRYKNMYVLLQTFPALFQLRPYQGKLNIHEVRRTQL